MNLFSGERTGLFSWRGAYRFCGWFERILERGIHDHDPGLSLTHSLKFARGLWAQLIYWGGGDQAQKRQQIQVGL